MSHQEEIHGAAHSADMPFGRIDTASVFQVPDHYFRDFPLIILSLIHAESETEAIVQHFPPNMPYVVPQDYFNRFADQLQNRIYQEADDALPAILNLAEIKQTPYFTPVDYFESLEKQLLTKIRDNALLETEVLSPLVAGLRDKPTFNIPADYFEKPKAKAISMPRTAEQSIKWTRWAAAAAIIFIFSLGGWKFLNNSSVLSQGNNALQILAHIPDAEIQEYLNYTLNDYDVSSLARNGGIVGSAVDNKVFEGISDQEIKDYLEYGIY
jgi:hypothetical protein